MQIDQPMPPGGQDPYDFILSGAPKPKLRLLPRTNSIKQRAILAGGVALVALFLFVIVVSLISNAGQAGTKALVALAQQQTEMARVSTAGTNQVRDAGILNFTQTVTLTLTSEQRQTINFLKMRGKKVGVKELALGRNLTTDKSLASAQANGNYDDVMLTTLQQELKDYQTRLSKSYQATSSTSEKIMLKQFYAQTSDLLANLPPTINP